MSRSTRERPTPEGRFANGDRLEEETPPASLSEATVGARIRALRSSMGLTLRDLTETSGVSTAMLSQVERGETSPTLTVAARIASGLGLTLSQLLRLDEPEPIVIVRTGDRRVIGRPSGSHSYELLTPPLPGQRLEVSHHTLRPRGMTGGARDPVIHERGSRETAIVEEGELVLTLGRRDYALGPGDAVTFDADIPHRFANSGSAEARFLSIVTAGLRSWSATTEKGDRTDGR